MAASEASDPSSVEYYFACTAGGGHDSGWQNSSAYEDAGLSPQTTYTYTVKARDKSGAQNETGSSTAESATTLPSALPGQATNPRPADGQIGLNRKTVILSWTAGTGATSHDVYLGTSPTFGSEDFKGNQTGTSYDPSVLRKGMMYYWRVDEVNSDGTTPGLVWSFTTQ
jgi:hypothetical protein